jgi:hypothetical protein
VNDQTIVLSGNRCDSGEWQENAGSMAGAVRGEHRLLLVILEASIGLYSLVGRR